MKTLHQVFNEVKEHLLTQNCKAQKDDTCVYLAPDETKCAIGCLIQPYAYDSIIEGTNANINLFKVLDNPFDSDYDRDFDSDYDRDFDFDYDRSMALNKALQLSGVPTHREAYKLYGELQGVHDGLDPEEWEDALNKVYNQYLA